MRNNESIPSFNVLVGDEENIALLFTQMWCYFEDKLYMIVIKSKDPLQQIKMLNENGHELSDFTDSEEIKLELQSEVNRLNEQFSNPEQLKKFVILPRDLTIDNGELTPLEDSKEEIIENWSEKIESMYES